jgi:branched-chain amino acid transport system permease protein
MVSSTVIMQGIVSGLLLGAIYGLVTVGLTLIFGVMDIINFAHGEFLTVGMYATWLLFRTWGVDPYVSLVVVIPLMFVLGAAIQKLVLNPNIDQPHANQLLITLGLSLIIMNTMLLIFKADYRSVSVPYGRATLTLGGVSISLTRLVAFGAAAMLSTVLYLILKTTDIGKSLRACAEDRDAAALMGINVKRMYVVAFGLGSICTGVAGTLLTPNFYIFPGIGLLFVMTAFVVMVLGGMGNFVGALIGGLIIGLAESLAAVFGPPALRTVVSYGIFVLVLWFRPQGILGKKKGI